MFFERVDLAPHGGFKIRWWAGRAHEKRHTGLVILRERLINKRRRALVEHEVFAIAHDANDLAPGGSRRSSNAYKYPLAYRVLSLEKVPRKRFVDNYYTRRAGSVLAAKIAALHDRNAHRFEII